MIDARPSVAVVDDEAPVLKALERLLRSGGYTVSTYETGTAFISSLAETVPECVVLDLHMPGMSGIEVQSRLNLEHPGKVGVVIMTAHATADSEQRALKAGASAYLKKPVDAHSLFGAVRDAIASRRACPPTEASP